MKIEKVKDWILHKGKQFKVICRSRGNSPSGVINEVARLKDEVNYCIAQNVTTPKWNGYIVEFNEDLVHVKVFAHNNIDNATFKINQLTHPARRPRRRVSAKR